MPLNAALNVVVPPVDSMSFLHRADAGNIGGSYKTTIDYPAINGDSNAIFQVTQNWNPSDVGGIYNDHAIGLWYAGGTWKIFQQDLADMPLGASFNIWVPPTGPSTFIHSATAGNITGNYTVIDNPQTNNNPDAALIVTQNWNLGGISNDHPIGVWYSFNANKWTVFNQDLGAMPVDAAFNVTVRTPTFIFSDGFEMGDTSGWSVVVP